MKADTYNKFRSLLLYRMWGTIQSLYESLASRTARVGERESTEQWHPSIDLIFHFHIWSSITYMWFKLSPAILSLSHEFIMTYCTQRTSERESKLSCPSGYINQNIKPFWWDYNMQLYYLAKYTVSNWNIVINLVQKFLKTEGYTECLLTFLGCALDKMQDSLCKNNWVLLRKVACCPKTLPKTK